MGVIALVSHSLPRPSPEIADDLFKQTSVVIMPGEVFGLKKRFRICYGLPVLKLKEALMLTDAFLEKQLIISASLR
jgi:aspartate/methionine/tyrosine aminotransferase